MNQYYVSIVPDNTWSWWVIEGYQAPESVMVGIPGEFPTEQFLREYLIEGDTLTVVRNHQEAFESEWFRPSCASAMTYDHSGALLSDDTADWNAEEADDDHINGFKPVEWDTTVHGPIPFPGAHYVTA